MKWESYNLIEAYISIEALMGTLVSFIIKIKINYKKLIDK